MPQYFDRLHDSLTGVRRQLDGITQLGRSAEDATAGISHNIDGIGNAARDRARTLDATLRGLTQLIGENNAMLRAGKALRYASENQALAQAYANQSRNIKGLEANMARYSARLAELQQVKNSLQAGDLDSYYNIEQAVDTIHKQQRQTAADLEVAKTNLIVISDNSTKAAVAGVDALHSWEQLKDSFAGWTTAFPMRMFASAVAYSGQLNADLIRANSSLVVRDKLYRDSVTTAARLGVSLSAVATAQAALTERGYDLRDTEKDRLNTTLRMTVALDASLESTSEIMALSDGIGANFNNVANHIARIVDDTAIAANEAERYAAALAKSALVTDQRGGNLGAVTEIVARVEDQLKQHGLDAGKFSQLVQYANTTEGLGTSLAHGGGMFEMLSNPDKMLTWTKTLVQRSQSFGSGAGGAMARKSYAESMGIDPELMADLFRHGQDYEKAVAEAMKKITGNELQKRWEAQIGATQESVNQLWTSLKNLVHVGLIPAVTWVNAFSRQLTKIFNAVSAFLSGDSIKKMDNGIGKTLAGMLQKTLSFAFRAGMPLLVFGLVAKGASALIRTGWGLAQSLLRLGTAAQIAATKINGAAGQMSGGPVPSGGKPWSKGRGIAIGLAGTIGAQLANEAVQTSEASQTTKDWTNIGFNAIMLASWFPQTITKWAKALQHGVVSSMTKVAPKLLSTLGPKLVGLLRFTPHAIATAIIANAAYSLYDSISTAFDTKKVRDDLALNRDPTLWERIQDGMIFESDRKALRESRVQQQLQPVKKELDAYQGDAHNKQLIQHFNEGWEDYTQFIVGEQRRMLKLIGGLLHVNDDVIDKLRKDVAKRLAADRLIGFHWLENKAQKNVVSSIRHATGRLTQPAQGDALQQARDNVYGRFVDDDQGRSVSRRSFFLPGGQGQAEGLERAVTPSQPLIFPALIQPPATAEFIAPETPVQRAPIPAESNEKRTTAAITAMQQAVVAAINKLQQAETANWRGAADEDNSKFMRQQLLTGSFTA